MSSYAQVSDLVAYVQSPMNSTDEELQTLLDNAERDVDGLFNPSQLTSSLQGFRLVGTVTSGSFTASLTWQGSVYTSPEIEWNSDSTDFLVALNASVDVLSTPILGAWVTPETPASAPNWAAGPFPDKAVVVEATGHLGEQSLPLFSVQSSLVGTDADVKVTQFRGGGVRYDIWQIRPSQVMALRRATCAQAEYRDQMGEDFYIRAQWDSVSGPEFRTTGKMPYIGPKVRRELAGSGLVQYAARAVVGTSRNSATSMSRMGNTTIPDDWRAV